MDDPRSATGSGASASNTITFQSNTGNPANVTLYYFAADKAAGDTNGHGSFAGFMMQRTSRGSLSRLANSAFISSAERDKAGAIARALEQEVASAVAQASGWLL